MQKWEYKIAQLSDLGVSTISLDDKMNIYFGRRGWELVSVDNGIAYFKRVLTEPAVTTFDPNMGIYCAGCDEYHIDWLGPLDSGLILKGTKKCARCGHIDESL